MDTLALATLLTASGAVAAALLVRQAVEILKLAFPAIDQRLSGRTQAFAISLGLYLAAFAAVGPWTPEGAFAAFAAWIACASAAVTADVAISASPLDRFLSRP